MEARNMNRGLKARFFLVFIVFFSFLGSARAGVWCEIVDLSTGKKITSNTIRLSMTRNQLALYKITAFYFRVNENPSIARLRTVPDKSNHNLPPYVENWTDQIDTLFQHSQQLENTFLIRPIAPESVGQDSFKVEASLRYGLSPKDALNSARVTFIITVTEPPYPHLPFCPNPHSRPGHPTP